MLIGAYMGNRGASDAGQTYLVLWPAAGTVRLGTAANAAFLCTASSDHSGRPIAGGDANGDGYSDVLIGADDHSFSTSDNGATCLFYGP